MSQITIGVINPAETEKVTMQVPDDVSVKDLTDAMVDAMGIPLRGEDGRRLNYHLNIRDRDGKLERLDKDATLEENEVREGDVLQLIVEMTAGCFPTGTRITLADGRREPIETLQIGDKVLSFSVDSQSVSISEIIEVFNGRESSYLIINDILRVTPSHLVFVNRNWRPAGILQLGDYLQDETGNSVIVNNLQLKTDDTEIYNLSLSKNATFFAEGLLVHNYPSKFAYAHDEEFTEFRVPRHSTAEFLQLVEKISVLEERVEATEAKLAEAAEMFSNLARIFQSERRVIIINSETVKPSDTELQTEENRILARLKINQEAEIFDEIKQDELIRSVAQLAKIPEDEINLVYILPGSVLVTLEMPKEGALRLMNLYLDNSPLLKELDISKIELRSLIEESNKLPQLPSRTTGSKVNFDYELGLSRLRDMLDGNSNDIKGQFHTLESRLLDYLRDEHWFGLSENAREGKARVIASFNQFVADNKLGNSFTELCQP